MLSTQFIGNLKNIKDCFVPILLPALSFSSPAGPMVLHSPVMTRGQRMSQLQHTWDTTTLNLGLKLSMGTIY